MHLDNTPSYGTNRVTPSTQLNLMGLEGIVEVHGARICLLLGAFKKLDYFIPVETYTLFFVEA